MRILRVAALAAGGLLLMSSQVIPAQAHGGPSYRWELTPTGSTAQFRGLAAVSKDVAWVGGTAGTVLRTVDGGRHWQNVSPAGAEALQFRDVQAFDAQRAVILSIGPGTDSRIYRTVNAGKTWTETFRNTDPNAFYDCMAFNGGGHGLALSDPVDGKFRIAATSNGGKSWKVQPNDGMPAALPGEFAFAASGTCLVAGPGRTAWFATGRGSSAPSTAAGTGRSRTRRWPVVKRPASSASPSAGRCSVSRSAVTS